MRLFLLTALTMSAFAANSVLTRIAVGGEAADPGSFAVVRVLSGAVALAFLVRMQGRRLQFAGMRRAAGAGALALYMIGFSVAYLTLDAGLGALILFGVVQITMFAVSAAGPRPPTPRQFVGALIAFGGLAYVLWPAGAASVDAFGAAMMVLAGLGWGIYTLAGRQEPDPLAATAANFIAALPVTALGLAVLGASPDMTVPGAGLAVLSGTVTSGLGYALRYRLVPLLGATRAATVQLCVPVIALGAGIVLLGEVAGLRLAVGTVLVLGGIALAMRRDRRG